MRKHDKEDVERLLASVRLEIALAKGDLEDYDKTKDPALKVIANKRLEWAEIDLTLAEGCL